MKPVIVPVCLLLSFVAKAQFAVVTDKDGVAYVRSGAAMGNNIVDTLSNGHLVFILQQQGNWSVTDYTKNNEQRNGFIYKDGLKEVSDYTFIPMHKPETSRVILQKDSIVVRIAEMPFDKAKHSFSYDDDSKNLIVKIDDKEFWGTDGSMPHTAYQFINGVVGKRKFSIPASGLENLYEVNLHNTSANYDSEADVLYIKSMNSDGAGAYYVIWKIVKGKYTDRQVFYGF